MGPVRGPGGSVLLQAELGRGDQAPQNPLRPPPSSTRPGTGVGNVPRAVPESSRPCL